MTYASLMVYVDEGEGAAARIGLACDLADLFEATLTGVSAAMPLPMEEDRKPGSAASERPAHRRAVAEGNLCQAEGLFRSIAHPRRRPVKWRSSLCYPADFVADECRCADLIIVGGKTGLTTAYDAPNPAEVFMRAGRPVLVVPAGLGKGSAISRVLVAWKETREARRAIVDALPFLKATTHVSVVEVAEGLDRHAAAIHVEDVAAFLRRHGVPSRPLVLELEGMSVADRLMASARENDVGLIVMGGYGHSRLHEWAFGGVTRAMLKANSICCLFSH